MKRPIKKRVRTGGPLLATFSALALMCGCKSTPPAVPPPAPVTAVTAISAQATRLTQDHNWTAAAGQWQKAADQYRLLNDLPQLAMALHNLGDAQRHLAQFENARANLNQAAALNEKLGLQNSWWSDQIGLLQLAAEANDETRLAEMLTALTPKAGQIQDATLRGMFLNELALAQRKRGEFAVATTSFQQAEEQFQKAGSAAGIAAIQANRAELLTAQTNYPAARLSWNAALTSFEKLADGDGITRVLYGLGRTLVLEGQDLAIAEDLLRRAAQNYRTFNRPVERRAALELLLQALLEQKKTNETRETEKELESLPGAGAPVQPDGGKNP